MVKENVAPAKSKLSMLVNAALAGEEVVLCKNGTPVVQLIPIRTADDGDPCRVIPELVIRAGEKVVKPLRPDDWGDLL